MHVGGIELVKIRENLWEIPATGQMKVPGQYLHFTEND